MADIKNDNSYQDAGQDRFEKSDASFTQIGVWMFVIAFLVVLTAFAVWGYFDYFTKVRTEEAMARRSPLLAEGQVVQQIPGPVLQLNPAAGMKVFLAQENKALTSYSWISRDAGVVRIPIDDAIKKVLTSGSLPTRKQAPETTATVRDDGASLPQDSSSGRTSWNLQAEGYHGNSGK